MNIIVSMTAHRYVSFLSIIRVEYPSLFYQLVDEEMGRATTKINSLHETEEVSEISELYHELQLIQLVKLYYGLLKMKLFVKNNPESASLFNKNREENLLGRDSVIQSEIQTFPLYQGINTNKPLNQFEEYLHFVLPDEYQEVKIVKEADKKVEQRFHTQNKRLLIEEIIREESFQFFNENFTLWVKKNEHWSKCRPISDNLIKILMDIKQVRYITNNNPRSIRDFVIERSREIEGVEDDKTI